MVTGNEGKSPVCEKHCRDPQTSVAVSFRSGGKEDHKDKIIGTNEGLGRSNAL